MSTKLQLHDNTTGKVLTLGLVGDLPDNKFIDIMHLDSVASGVDTMLADYVPISQRAVANGIATLDEGGKIPSSQLPSYVDDIVERTNLAAFPSTGETGKIYVALNDNKTYRWSGSAYVKIASGSVDSVNGQTGIVNITTVSGNAGTATKLATARNISLSGDASGSVAFDGTGNVTIPVVVSNNSHTHAISNIDGLQTALNAKVDDTQVLTNVPSGAKFTDTVYTHPTTAGNKHIPTGGSGGMFLSWSASGTAVWSALPIASSSATGIVTTGAQSFGGNKTFDSITANTITETSARKYKEKIEQLTGCLNAITQMEPVKYVSKEDGSTQIGLIADDVYKVRPEYVMKVDDKVEGLHYQRIVTDLIGAVKEQQLVISEMQSEINHLNNIVKSV